MRRRARTERGSEPAGPGGAGRQAAQPTVQRVCHEAQPARGAERGGGRDPELLDHPVGETHAS